MVRKKTKKEAPKKEMSDDTLANLMFAVSMVFASMIAAALYTWAI